MSSAGVDTLRIWGYTVYMTNTHTAAILTANTVHQAMRVRGLNLAEAVALVAAETGATVDEVEAMTLAGVRLATEVA